MWASTDNETIVLVQIFVIVEEIQLLAVVAEKGDKDIKVAIVHSTRSRSRWQETCEHLILLLSPPCLILGDHRSTLRRKQLCILYSISLSSKLISKEKKIPIKKTETSQIKHHKKEKTKTEASKLKYKPLSSNHGEW